MTVSTKDRPKTDAITPDAAGEPEIVGTDTNTVTLTAVPLDRNADRIGHRGADLAWIPAKRISIDPVYQRGLNVRRVNDIAENFDIDVFGTVLVSLRQDGSMWALDGQHRMAAVQTIYGHDSGVKVPCHILRGLTVEGEARIFYKMNRNRLAPTAFDGFKARLAFKDPVAVAIKQSVDDHGLTLRFYLASTLKYGDVQAIAECENLYRAGMLDEVLDIIEDGWRGEDRAHKGIIMRGLHSFLTRFHDEFYGDDLSARMRADRRQRLIDTLAENIPVSLERRSKEFQHDYGDGSALAIAHALHRAYNHRLRTGVKLSRWGREEESDAV